MQQEDAAVSGAEDSRDTIGEEQEPASGEEGEPATGEDDEGLVTDDWDWEWDEESREIVRMGEDITVGHGKRVRGDVVAVGGSVTIYGQVTGDVIAVGGNVTLMSGSMVRGDAVSVGGTLEREEGAVLEGQEVSVSMGPWNINRWLWGFPQRTYIPHYGARGLSIWWDFLRYAGFFLIGLILYYAFPKRMAVIRETTRSSFWLGLLTGFGSVLGVIVALILLIITCIGILVAIPGFFLSVLAVIGGGSAAVVILGEVIFRRQAKSAGSWIGALALGTVLLFAVQFVGQLLDLAGGPGNAIGGSLKAIVKVAWFVLFLSGFGALVLSRIGKRVPGTQLATPSGPPPPGALPPRAPGDVPPSGPGAAPPSGPGAATPSGPDPVQPAAPSSPGPPPAPPT
jgi:hypothetical protein